MLHLVLGNIFWLLTLIFLLGNWISQFKEESQIVIALNWMMKSLDSTVVHYDFICGKTSLLISDTFFTANVWSTPPCPRLNFRGFFRGLNRLLSVCQGVRLRPYLRYGMLMLCCDSEDVCWTEPREPFFCLLPFSYRRTTRTNKTKQNPKKKTKMAEESKRARNKAAGESRFLHRIKKYLAYNV